MPDFPSGAIVAQALVPFPQYYGFNTDGHLENLGQSTYNALEAQLTRRFRNGLNLMASYTWSKTLTDADSALPYFATLHQGGAPQNVFNKQGDKAISNQDLPQNFVLSYIYELPFGKNKKFLNSSKRLGSGCRGLVGQRHPALRERPANCVRLRHWRSRLRRLHSLRLHPGLIPAEFSVEEQKWKLRSHYRRSLCCGRPGHSDVQPSRYGGQYASPGFRRPELVAKPYLQRHLRFRHLAAS